MVLLAALLVYRTYSRGEVPSRIRSLCAPLKLLGFLLLALCVLEPRWTGRRARPGTNQVALLMDSSLSMTIREPESEGTRGEQAVEIWKQGGEGWLRTLSSFFQIRHYTFTTDAHPEAKGFEGVEFKGSRSDLARALTTLQARHRGRPLAGILIFTDGISTDDVETLLGTWDGPPLYPVPVGTYGPFLDLGLGTTTVSETPFEDAPVTLEAVVLSQGLQGEAVEVVLLDAGGESVATETIQLTQGETPVRFRVKPERSGPAFYRMVVRLARAGGEGEEVPRVEAIEENNSRWVAVNPSSGPFRLLYVSGRPNWEYKFLQRALEEDAERLELVGLIRIAKREPKFQFKGRANETSNPLFRGFDQVDEATSEYDQPVVLRLNVRDDEELKAGFPKTAKDLFAYHAVILDDLEASFFSTHQQGLLRDFVAERGGGVLMLGGQESLNRGGYVGTPLQDALPVFLRGSEQEVALPSQRMELSREGWLSPWLRVRDSENSERDRIASMPDFDVINRVGTLKPGAQVLAWFRNPGEEGLPALVTQRFGHGRAAVFTAGDWWRWALKDEADPEDFGKSWRQMMRWLVSDVPERLQVRLEWDEDSPRLGPAIVAHLLNPEFRPLLDGEVAFGVEPGVPGMEMSSRDSLMGDSDSSSPGSYHARLYVERPGPYKVTATARDEQGLPVSKIVTGWVSGTDASEFGDLKVNREQLEWLARQTGGRLVEPSELEDLASLLPEKELPVMETWSYPIWHTPWMFLAAVGCFLAEWGVRRWHALS